MLLGQAPSGEFFGGSFVLVTHADLFFVCFVLKAFKRYGNVWWIEFTRYIYTRE